jgi:hypothetical protein
MVIFFGRNVDPETEVRGWPVLADVGDNLPGAFVLRHPEIVANGFPVGITHSTE